MSPFYLRGGRHLFLPFSRRVRFDFPQRLRADGDVGPVEERSLRKLISSLLLTAMAVMALGQPYADPRAVIRSMIHSGPKDEVVHGRLLVKYRPSEANRIRESFAQSRAVAVRDAPVRGAIFRGAIGQTGWTKWDVPAIMDPRALARQALSHPGVIQAQPANRIYKLMAEPNDPDWLFNETSPEIILGGDGDIYFRRLWHLVESQAMEAWTIWPNRYWTAAQMPTDRPTIAIIDTGADMHHPDFINAGGTSSNAAVGGQLIWEHSGKPRLNLTTGEITVGGVDDADDFHGHGTHVAGLAVAAGNNGAFSSSVNQGTIGSGFNSKAMILRVFDSSGTGTDADAAMAIYYAVDNGADIINLSLGTTNWSPMFQDAVTYAWQKGALVVAAGNENGSGGGNLGPIYPAACSGALGVTANGPFGFPATSTYAGTGSYVDISAPGGDILFSVEPFYYMIQFIYSTAMRGPGVMSNMSDQGILYPPYWRNYAYVAGTSMASPIVAGAAGLYMGKNNLRQGHWSNVRTYRALQQSATGLMGAPYGGWETTQGYGVLDMETLMLDGVGLNRQPTNPNDLPVGSVEGIVYFNTTPMANVRVELRTTAGTIVKVTSTNVHGYYRFDGAPAGVFDVRAIPSGVAKTKRLTIRPYSDLTGFDFWVGTTFDETPPVAATLELESIGSSSVSFRHWGYDTETGLDLIEATIGTAQGASDVMAARRLDQEIPNQTLTGLSLPTSGALWLNVRYVNGAGMSTTRSLQIRAAAAVVTGTVELQDWSRTTAGEVVRVRVRTPGTTTTLEEHNVTLGANGSMSFTTNLTGTFDIAIQGRTWLQSVLRNVTITSGGASGLSVSLFNGDVNGDNRITITDYNLVAAAFRATSSSSNWNPNADLNGSGQVTVTDYNIVAKNFRRNGEP